MPETLAKHMEVGARLVEYLRQPGVPAFDEKGQFPDHFVLDPVRIMDLFRTPFAFFQLNPVFEPMRKGTMRALKLLIREGIIESQSVGDPPPARRKAPCKSCTPRKLWAVAQQVTGYVQKVALQSVNDPKVAQRFATDLRSYMTRTMGLKPDQQIVLLARMYDGSIQEILL